MLFSITAPAVNDRGPRYMQAVFAALKESLGRGEVLELYFAPYQGQIGLFCRVAESSSRAVMRLVQSKYPACRLEIVPDDALDPPAGLTTYAAELTLRPSIFPLLRLEQFEDMLERKLDDPIELLCGTIQGHNSNFSQIQIAVTPASAVQAYFCRHAVQILDRPFLRTHFLIADLYAAWITRRWLWLFVWPLRFLAAPRDIRFDSKTDTTASRNGDRTDNVQAAADKIGGHLFNVRIRLVASAPSDCRHAAQQHIRSMASAFTGLTLARLAVFRLGRIRRCHPARFLKPSRRHSFLLSHLELATLFHPPTSGVQTERLATTAFTELEPPVELPTGRSDGEAMLGSVCFRGDGRTAGILPIDRHRHLYIAGRTGVGKTTLLENLIRGDIAAGNGVCVIDPHGDLAETILASIPSGRTNDVIVFDPAVTGRPNQSSDGRLKTGH